MLSPLVSLMCVFLWSIFKFKKKKRKKEEAILQRSVTFIMSKARSSLTKCISCSTVHSSDLPLQLAVRDACQCYNNNQRLKQTKTNKSLSLYIYIYKIKIKKRQKEKKRRKICYPFIQVKEVRVSSKHKPARGLQAWSSFLHSNFKYL